MSKGKKTKLEMPFDSGLDTDNFVEIFEAEDSPVVPMPKPAPKKLRELALEEAQKALDAGVKEQGENWGPQVKEYLKAAGVTTPAPWCAAFVNWCAEQGAKPLGITSTQEEVVNEAYCPSYAAWAEKRGWLVKPTWDAAKKLWVIPGSVKPGHLFLVWSPSRKRYAHIGYVKSVDQAAGRFVSIEGNSNDTGSREGLEVASNNRMVTKDIAFIIWE